MQRRDQDLERLFEEARERDGRRVPSFVQVLERRRETKHRPRTALVIAIAAVILAAIAIWRYATPNEPKLEIAFTAGEMYVPTDYLLDMMHVPRAGEVPRIGAADWYPLPLSGDANPDTRRTP
jgi:hypothetical protein